MRFTTLGAAAAVTAISQAFLLPPTSSSYSSDNDVVNALPFDAALEADGRLITVDCPGCPISFESIQGGRHVVQGPNRLQLNFSVAHEEDMDRVLLNGRPFYPFDPESRFIPFTARQMIRISDTKWAEVSNPELGFQLTIPRPITDPKDDQLDLITALFEITEVGKKFVDAIPSVELKLLQTPSGKLMIGDAQIVPAKSHAASPTDDGQECTTLLCKWRAIIADRLAKLKSMKGGCKGGKTFPTVAGVPPAPAMDKPHHGHGRPRPHGHHGGHKGHGGHGRPHHFHHKHHGLARFFRGVILHIFVPVIIGIMAGITASLVGMVVGHVVIFIWRLLFRRGSKGAYTKVQQEEASMEEGVEDEKTVVQHQGPPPVYEDVVKEDNE